MPRINKITCVLQEMRTVSGNLTTALALEVFIEEIYKLLLITLSKDTQRSYIIRIQNPHFMVSTLGTTLQHDSCTAPLVFPSGQCLFFSFSLKL